MFSAFQEVHRMFQIFLVVVEVFIVLYRARIMFVTLCPMDC